MGLFAVPAIIYVQAYDAKEADEVAADVKSIVAMRLAPTATILLDEELPTVELPLSAHENPPASILQTHPQDVSAHAMKLYGQAGEEILGGPLEDSLVTRVIGNAL